MLNVLLADYILAAGCGDCIGVTNKAKPSYPERFAQEDLGHNLKAVNQGYVKRALMKPLSLEVTKNKRNKRNLPAVNNYS